MKHFVGSKQVDGALLKQIGGNNKTLENEYFVMSH
jgi:hypothetical protein